MTINEEEEQEQRLAIAQCLLNVTTFSSASQAGLIKEMLDFGPKFLSNLVVGLSFVGTGSEPDEMERLKLAILVNMSRDLEAVDKVLDVMKEKKLEAMVNCLVGTQDSGDKSLDVETLNLLLNLLINLSQLQRCRDFLLKDETKLSILLETLFKPWREQPSVDSQGLKQANMLLVKNLCLDNRFHQLLVGETVDIIPKLLYPITGPTSTEFDDEQEMSLLPVELQYLPQDKEREIDPDIRGCLLDSLLLLCDTAFGRKATRDSNAYLILRELHKREQNQTLQNSTANIIDILIKDEEEYKEYGNLREIPIPEDLSRDFKDMDKELDQH
jgi:hypothetical protein